MTKKRLCGNCPAHEMQTRIDELMEERRDLYKQVQEYARCISIEQAKNKRLQGKVSETVGLPGDEQSEEQ